MLERKRMILNEQAPDSGVYVAQGAGVVVSLTLDDYEAMGRPSNVTVTVEPGDQLNPER